MLSRDRITLPDGLTQDERKQLGLVAADELKQREREQFAAGLHRHIRAAVAGEERKQREKQRKLDQQAQQDLDAKREARRLEQNAARQKRFRLRMKAKALPKLTMVALAKAVGVRRETLWRHGLRATKLRNAVSVEAVLQRFPALAHATKTRDLDRALNTPEAALGTIPGAAAPQPVSPHLLTAVPSPREHVARAGHSNGHDRGPSPPLRAVQPCPRRERACRSGRQGGIEVFRAEEAVWWPISGNGYGAATFDGDDVVWIPLTTAPMEGMRH